jgi:hypothetical protein
MKIKTAEACKRLNIHVAELFQLVLDYAPDIKFSDVWPEIDEDWVSTISAIDKRRFVHDSNREVLISNSQSPLYSQELSPNAVHVLDKLHKKHKYGSVSVAFDTLMNITHTSKKELEHVLAELRRGGFLDQDGQSLGKISLNSSKTKEIENHIKKN